MLRGFDGRGFKVSVFFSRSFLLVCPSNLFQGEFAVPPGLHAMDFLFYFPETFVLLFAGVFPSLVSTTITTFGKSFSESFLNFALTLNTTMKWDPSDITPTNWELWDGINEMLFNVTESGAPDIHSVTTSSALLERCE